MNKPVEILLVEDNPHDVILTLDAFELHKLSNKIHVARDGEEALDYLFCRAQYIQRDMGDRPKFVLLDLKLPKVDGIEVLRQIRADPRTSTIPVVILTSSKEDRDIVAGYKLGVNSYIVKPVDFEKFTESVRTLGLYWLLMNQPPLVPSTIGAGI